MGPGVSYDTWTLAYCIYDFMLAWRRTGIHISHSQYTLAWKLGLQGFVTNCRSFKDVHTDNNRPIHCTMTTLFF